MLCRRPFRGNGVQLFGCGQCMPCRVNKRRKWTARLLMECECHEHNTFLTLTYAPEFLPAGGSLRPLDYKRFLKNLFNARGGVGTRYYVVGEYGDKSMRPHYHFILFGVHPQQYEWLKLWKKGHIYAGHADIGSHSYVTGYVTKKMTRSHDARLKLLNGSRLYSYLIPEFARMSLRPAVGADAMRSLASQLVTRQGSAALAALGDIPNELRIGGKTYPLDRWCKAELRRLLAFPNFGSDSPGCQKAQARVQAVLDRDEQTAPVPLPIMDPVVWRYTQLTESAYQAFKARRAIFEKERSL